jgi:HlyD family type I secretion membrane fusion protein
MTASRHPATGIRGTTLFGLSVVAVFFAAMGGWAAKASLSGAVIAQGSIKVSSDRQPVKNQTSAIVSEVLVSEGQDVAADQLLLRLDDIQSRAQVEQLSGELDALLAEEGRLSAERAGAQTIEFPPELRKKESQPAVVRILAQQERLFASRRSAFDGQLALIQQTVRQLEDQIVGKRAEVASQDRQLELIRQETEDTRYLFNKGYAPKSKLLALERAEAALEGAKASLTAGIAEAEKSIEESRLRMRQLQKDWLTEVDGDFGKVRKQIDDVQPRLRAAGHQLGLTEIRAPVAGRILSLLVRSPGRVIQPTDVLMEIVPSSQALVVEAAIKPDEVDDVVAGMPAEVKLTAFNQRLMPRLNATVIQVSADRLVDQRSGGGYYQVLLTINPEDVAAASGVLGRHVALLPGMPAVATIATRERTVLDYLLAPIYDGLDRAMREQ